MPTRQLKAEHRPRADWWRRWWPRRRRVPEERTGDLGAELSAAVVSAARAWPDDERLLGLRAALARLLVRREGTTFAAVLPGEDWMPDPGAAITLDDKIAACRAGAAEILWFDRSEALTGRLGSAGNGRAAGEAHAASEFLDGGVLPPSLAAGSETCLLASAAAGARPQLHLLVGCDAAPAVVGAVARDCRDVLRAVTPLLAARLHLAVLRSELESLAAENDVLTRLGRLQGEFVAVASHELKTPLTSICAYTDVLRQGAAAGDPAQQDEFLAVIKEESERLLRMVNRILDYSRLEFGRQVLQPRAVGLEGLVDQVVRSLHPLADRKSLHLKVEHEPGLPEVAGDPDLIRQVLVNLLGNAIKYTPDHGRVRVRTRESAATVALAVADDGPGIPARDLRRIFRQFYRAGARAETEEGVGLGLSIVRNILNLHEAHIDVQSREGEGATFSIFLPKIQHASAAPTVLSAADPSPEDLRSILQLGVRMIAELMRARTVAIVLRTADGGELVIASALGLPAASVAAYRDPGREGEMGEALRDGRPRLAAAGGPADPLVGDGVPPGTGGARAIVPLRDGRECLGAIVLARKEDAEPLTAVDLEMAANLGEKVEAALVGMRRRPRDAVHLKRLAAALRALARLHRSEIPTATPLALRLLSRTAARLGLSRSDARRLLYVASLHDAGMVQVDEEILGKPGDLSDDERDQVDRHPESGATLMAPLLSAPEMRDLIVSHHERVDGTGYPQGRAGREIPLGSRILAVVDAFFAMITGRPYREPKPTSQVVAEIRQHAGTQFDPQVVEEFLAVLRAEGILARSHEDEADRNLAATTTTERD